MNKPEPKKPREFWILPCRDNGFYDIILTDRPAPIIESASDFIHVREVVEV